LFTTAVRSGKRAKEFCDRLGQHLAPDSKLNLSLWSLSALQLLPVMAQAAAREAERATLLIVAVNGDKTLPRPVKNCLHWCAMCPNAPAERMGAGSNPLRRRMLSMVESLTV